MWAVLTAFPDAKRANSVTRPLIPDDEIVILPRFAIFAGASTFVLARPMMFGHPFAVYAVRIQP